MAYDQDIRAKAIALYDRFTHETHDRRAFMAELTTLAGGAAAANALLLGIAASPAAAAMIPADDKRLHGESVSWPIAGGTMRGYLVRPATTKKPLPAVVVIHENRGLTEHIRDVARRLALDGFLVLAPDFLTPLGGTPDDQDKARTMIGTLDLVATVANGVATLRWLKAHSLANDKVGAIGFCWGGAMVNRLAVASGTLLSAAVPYYGPAPAPAEAIKVQTPMLLQYAGKDDRVNASGVPWVAALKAAHVDATAYTYAGVDHAFNNDTSVERYDAAAAKLAWGRTVTFLKEHVK